MAEIQPSVCGRDVEQDKTEKSRKICPDLKDCQQAIGDASSYSCIQEGSIVTANSSFQNFMQDGICSELLNVSSMTAVSGSRLKKCNVANINYGGMGNTIYNCNFSIQDVADIMNHIHKKDAWRENNVAKFAGTIVSPSRFCQDDMELRDPTSLQSASQEYSLAVESQSKLEPGKQFSGHNAPQKTGNCAEENQDVRLKSTVKLCQTPLKTTSLPANNDVCHPPARKPKSNYVTCQPQSASVTNPSTFDSSICPRGYSVDLHTTQSSLQEEPSTAKADSEFRLAKVEKDCKEYQDFILSLKEHFADLQNVSDIRVRTVARTNIEKIVKIAELHPEKMKNISAYLDGTLMSDYEMDTPTCCNVM